MSQGLFEKVRAIVAGVFNLPLDQIVLASSPATVEPWDSMGHLTLVLALEQDLGVQLAPEQVERMTDVAAIVEVLAGLGC